MNFSFYFQKYCVALRFLTILPVRWRRDEDPQHYATSSSLFPMVGLTIGGGAALFALLCNQFLSSSVTAGLLIAFFALLSGFLHLDGLADSCDGLMSARSKERSLEIMKDSNTGAMGVVGLLLVLLIKYASLSSIEADALPLACLLIPVAGRCALLFVMATQRYAREEGSTGSLFYSKESKRTGIIGSVFFMAIFSMLSLPVAFLFLLVIYAVVFLFGKFCKKRIGGATGDTLGATSEICEMTCALLLSAIL